MTWLKQESRVASKPEKGISVELRMGKADGKPRCVIHFSKVAAQKVSWVKKGSPVGLYIGDGDHRGKIRIEHVNGQADAPPVIAEVSGGIGGSARLDLGHIPSLENEPRQSVQCEFTSVDQNTIEIVLPVEWPKVLALPAPRKKKVVETEDTDEEEDEHVEAKEPVRVAKPPPYVPPPVSAARAPVSGGTHNPSPSRPSTNDDKESSTYSNSDHKLSNGKGIVVSTEPDNEYIFHAGGKVTGLSAKQALFLRCLAAAAPEPVDSLFLVKKVLGQNRVKDSSSKEVLKMMASTISVMIKDIDLRIDRIPSTGDFKLVEDL